MKLRFRLGPITQKPLAQQHGALENGADLRVNERQKIRHYRATSTEERRRIRRRNSDFFYFARCFYTLIRLEISRRTRWWCLKCVIVYLGRAIQAFVMYCVNGTSRSSLLIESTDSMTCQTKLHTPIRILYVYTATATPHVTPHVDQLCIIRLFILRICASRRSN